MAVLVGRFGSLGVGKLLVNYDDAQGGLHDRIKEAISTETVEYESQGHHPEVVPNRTHWVFTTNSKSLVEDVNDPRFVSLECSEEHSDDGDYYEVLKKWMSEDLHVAAFHKHLRTLDISGVDWVEDRPQAQLLMKYCRRELTW